jgi:hypothetical protein
VANAQSKGDWDRSYQFQVAHMSDDKGNRGSPDRDRIDINDEDEVRNWTKSLGVSKEELQKAVQAAGPVADQVRDYLGRHRTH